ncbi:putative ArsR family transcriptional regulator [Bradyrhizobium diazoefficiens]
MEMPEQPRSRRQTRAAILTHLLQSGGSFRPPLAKAVRLSEASLSRILFDLKAEGLIEEVRRALPLTSAARRAWCRSMVRWRLRPSS